MNVEPEGFVEVARRARGTPRVALRLEPEPGIPGVLGDPGLVEQLVLRLGILEADALLAEGTRVVGPKRTGTLTVYAPLEKGEELDLAGLPRRSAKETFFPPCETILSFEKHDGKTTVSDPDLDRLPETVLIGVRPCDAAAPGILDAVFSWDYDDPFYLERRKRTTIIGIACTRADDACFCTAVGYSPAESKGSDIFLTPLEGGGFGVESLLDMTAPRPEYRRGREPLVGKR